MEWSSIAPVRPGFPMLWITSRKQGDVREPRGEKFKCLLYVFFPPPQDIQTTRWNMTDGYPKLSLFVALFKFFSFSDSAFLPHSFCTVGWLTLNYVRITSGCYLCCVITMERHAVKDRRDGVQGRDGYILNQCLTCRRGPRPPSVCWRRVWKAAITGEWIVLQGELVG